MAPGPLASPAEGSDRDLDTLGFERLEQPLVESANRRGIDFIEIGLVGEARDRLFKIGSHESPGGDPYSI